MRAKQAVNGHDELHVVPRKRRSRRRPFDGRTRQARAWRAAFDSAMASTGGRSEGLCRTYASLSIKRVQLDNQIASGIDVDVDVLLRVSSELRRTMARLNADACRSTPPMKFCATSAPMPNVRQRDDQRRAHPCFHPTTATRRRATAA